MALQQTDYEKIRQVLYDIAYAQDTLDWQLFRRCWIQPELIDFDVAGHLDGYKVQKLPVKELVRLSQEALGGFDCSQHVVTNITIASDEEAAAAGTAGAVNVRALITAFHYLDLARAEGVESQSPVDGRSNEAIMRGVWKLKLVKNARGDWTIKSINVSRLAPLTGNANLYSIAKKRFHDGLGRRPFTE
ncbi:hypothetical protein NLG97_g2622 [Lecanicillium saksenae]|uniref:Uncharacterized protein n=1 Tax=Lecanicillium saksenae TaxID=468837 RepID=A0ACC1R1U6_9HYPO|nr:hypothetical protein NLG97_g2622 [Lecanicillium saksenae]